MKEGFKNFEHVGICSPNTKRLAKWYMDIFGMEIFLIIKKDPETKSVYFLKSDGMIIEILPSARDKQIKRNLDDCGISHIGVVVSNFDGTAKYLREKGITLENIRETSLGWKIGYFEDLDGNTIEIVNRPKGI